MESNRFTQRNLKLQGIQLYITLVNSALPLLQALFYFPYSFIKYVNTFRIILDRLYSTLFILILFWVCVFVGGRSGG